MDFAAPYATYVLAAYGLSLAVLALAVVWALSSWRQAKRNLGRIQDSETKI
jgi:heme exporter protein CcmD